MEQQHPSFGNGKICYVVIPAIDIETSAAFYEKVFGWHIYRKDGHTSFDDSVTQVSGTWITGCEPHSGTGFSLHIMVFDMKASVAAIIANGGTILRQPHMDAQEVTADFRDPAGNVFGLYLHRI